MGVWAACAVGAFGKSSISCLCNLLPVCLCCVFVLFAIFWHWRICVAVAYRVINYSSAVVIVFLCLFLDWRAQSAINMSEFLVFCFALVLLLVFFVLFRWFMSSHALNCKMQNFQSKNCMLVKEAWIITFQLRTLIKYF